MTASVSYIHQEAAGWEARREQGDAAAAVSSCSWKSQREQPLRSEALWVFPSCAERLAA
jgi:hypothetical protein